VAREMGRFNDFGNFDFEVAESDFLRCVNFFIVENEDFVGEVGEDLDFEPLNLALSKDIDRVLVLLEASPLLLVKVLIFVEEVEDKEVDEEVEDDKEAEEARSECRFII